MVFGGRLPMTTKVKSQKHQHYFLKNHSQKSTITYHKLFQMYFCLLFRKNNCYFVCVFENKVLPLYRNQKTTSINPLKISKLWQSKLTS